MAIIQSVKNGHYLSFDEDKHQYILDGKRVPGATTFVHGGYVASQALIIWMIRQGSGYTLRMVKRLIKYKPNRIFTSKLAEAIVKRSSKAGDKAAKRAATIGTFVHDYAYQTEVNGTVSEELLSKIRTHRDYAKINLGVQKFTAWHSENQDQMVASEAVVASVRHSFGGKFDRLSRRNGLITLSDFKTSSGIFVDQFIQLAAYRIAIREWMGLDVQQIEILRFGKEDGEFETKLIKEPEELKSFEEQAIRCRETYIFASRWNNDKRFKWGGKK